MFVFMVKMSIRMKSRNCDESFLLVILELQSLRVVLVLLPRPVGDKNSVNEEKGDDLVRVHGVRGHLVSLSPGLSGFALRPFVTLPEEAQTFETGRCFTFPGGLTFMPGSPEYPVRPEGQALGH